MGLEIKSELIDNYRKENNLTVAQFCKKCKISKNTYYNLMKSQVNDMRLETLRKIAEITKLRCDDILGITK